MLPFSGGGTRAAAFPYGVLEELGRTEITVDAQRRRPIMNLPTSFVLPAGDVDKLREVAGRLVRQSPEYQTIVSEMGGAPAK